MMVMSRISWIIDNVRHCSFVIQAWAVASASGSRLPAAVRFALHLPIRSRMQESLEYKGQFHIVRKVAVGGMATVYEAEQLGPAGFAKRIALKVIHPHSRSGRNACSCSWTKPSSPPT